VQILFNGKSEVEKKASRETIGEIQKRRKEEKEKKKRLDPKRG
jgi:hypothetical protein